jgi:hypothetical protein
MVCLVLLGVKMARWVFVNEDRVGDQARSRCAEKQRGVTDRSVTPRKKLVELRGLEPLTPRLPALCSPN